ncbi:MAG: DsrE family protein [Hydrogenovibrio sp.]|nr:DsrE family protein [Hydrogenovibrio sp.]
MSYLTKCFKWAAVPAFFVFFSLQAFAASTEILPVQQKHDIRVVYDVNQDQQEAGIGKALYYVRGLLEAYKKQHVPMKEIHISVVVHGGAGYWLLKNKPYQNHVGNPFDVNPNKKVVQELIQHGVSVELCHVTMKAHGWTAKDVLPGVKIVFDAYTRMIDLQMRGYAYIKFV